MFCKVSGAFTAFNEYVCKNANCSKIMQYIDVNRSKNVVEINSIYYAYKFDTPSNLWYSTALESICYIHPLANDLFFQIQLGYY